MTGLPQFGHSAVIAHKESTTGLAVVLCLLILRHISLVYTFIVMYKDGRNINAIRARHTVLTVVAGNGGVGNI
jgi:hypothetical protein